MAIAIIVPYLEEHTETLKEHLGNFYKQVDWNIDLNENTEKPDFSLLSTLSHEERMDYARGKYKFPEQPNQDGIKVTEISSNFKGTYVVKMPNQNGYKLRVPNNKKIEYIPLEEVIHIKASNNYSYCHLTDKRALLNSVSIINFDRLLTNYLFIRVNQSSMVNIVHIREYHKYHKGHYFIMSNKDKIDISRGHTKKIKLMEQFKIL